MAIISPTRRHSQLSIHCICARGTLLITEFIQCFCSCIRSCSSDTHRELAGCVQWLDVFSNSCQTILKRVVNWSGVSSAFLITAYIIQSFAPCYSTHQSLTRVECLDTCSYIREQRAVQSFSQKASLEDQSLELFLWSVHRRENEHMCSVLNSPKQRFTSFNDHRSFDHHPSSD